MDRTEPRPKILVVDDTPANLVAMRHLLAKVEAELDLVESGEAAIAACRQRSYALILLDVQMPGLDGFEVAERLSSEENTRETPIIFVTGTGADDVSRMRAYRSGAVDYINKPIDPFILRSKVQVFLDLHRSRRQLESTLQELLALNRKLVAEVAERERLAALAQHQALHDPLTGLPNRRCFMDTLADRLKTAERLSLLYLDIDGFKPVNDQFGHPAGDALLVAIAGRLRAAVRDDDLCARLGGDEFALIAFGCEETAARTLAQTLLARLNQPFTLDVPERGSLTVRVGASIGLALAPTHGQDVEGLIHAADTALYAAKRQGKGRYVTAEA